MYYMLGCFGPVDEHVDRTRVVGALNTDVSWYRGRRFETPPPSPIEAELDPESPGVLVPMFDAAILLFSDSMIGALKEAGVDNIDYYDTIIYDRHTGATHTNYKAANIIGLVRCADLGNSVYQAHSGPALIDTDFDSLAIDEERTMGLLMFRLAECITGVVIHEKVKAALERSQIPYLNFYEPAEWIG